MAPNSSSRLKPALLCVVPPWSPLNLPVAGIAYLLAYARRNGCFDFDFLDLRLAVPSVDAPAYVETGVHGESYVIDIPDLPLVLSLAQSVKEGKEPLSELGLVMNQYCRERGISEAYLTDYLKSLDRYLASAAAQLQGVRFVGCSVWAWNYFTTLLFAAHLKRLPQPPVVVLGGPQSTQSPASAAIALRSRLVDYVVIGEGEATLLDLYSRIKSRGLGPCNVAGTASLGDNEQVHYAPKRPLLKPGEVPIPVFDQMPLVSYQKMGRRTLPFHLSRGCTDKCTFCSEWVFWERFRPGDAFGTLEGMRELQALYGANHIRFSDSLLNGHPGKLQQFAEGMLHMPRKLEWSGFMRANMDPQTAALLHRAGCTEVFVGVESLSDETLALMNKRRTEPQNIAAMKAFLGAGINVKAGLIPGFPGDSKEAFNHTIDELHSLQKAYPGRLRVNVEPFIVMPSQPLFSNLEEIGLRGIPWDGKLLDIAPDYRDITDSMLCTVEGAQQGMERMARLRIAGAVQSDEPVQGDTHDYEKDIVLSRSYFHFEYLTTGWHLARLQSESAWVYALIVNDEERRKLQRISAGNLALPSSQRLLLMLELRHLIPPPRSPQVIRGGYAQQVSVTSRYRLSPFAVCRSGDLRLNNHLIVADFTTASWRLLSARSGHFISLLQQQSHTVDSLCDLLPGQRGRRSRREIVTLMKELSEIGLVHIVERSDHIVERSDHIVERSDHIVERSDEDTNSQKRNGSGPITFIDIPVGRMLPVIAHPSLAMEASN